MKQKSAPIDIRKAILEQGVRNLKEYGYPTVTVDNILKDYIFANFFKVMLEDNLGASPTTDPVITELLAEVEKVEAPK